MLPLATGSEDSEVERPHSSDRDGPFGVFVACGDRKDPPRMAMLGFSKWLS